MKSGERRTLLLLGSLALVFSSSICSRAAMASGIVVNSTADTVNNADGLCTLREAISQANTDAGPAGLAGECGGGSGADTISFSVSGTITLGSTLPAIDDDLTIDGAGQAIAVSGNGAVRVMEVNNGATVTLDTLTITDGRSAANDVAGGIYNAGTLSLVKSTISDNLSTEAGGGIYNTGMLNVTDSTFSGNRVDTGGLGSTIGGGGIYNTGTFTIADSTFAGNYGEASAGGGGGAISSMGTASIASSTFTGNGSGSGSAIYHGVQVLDISNSTFGGQTGGAAIAVDSGGVVDITNSTIANNSGVVRSGGIFLRTGRVTLRNSIVSGNSPADCYDGSLELWADAFNLDSDGTCRSATQKTTGEIGLGALADNGGPTETMALGPASAAIDAGNDAVCAAAVGSPTYGAGGKDQRGVARSQGAACDVGAFEIGSTTQTGPGLVVNSTADTIDGFCDDLGQGIANKDCTLGEAINAANALTGADTITFEVPAVDAGCTAVNVCTITLGSTLPAIDDDLTIDGAGQAIAVSGNGAVRVMEVNNGATVTLDTLTITDGRSAANDVAGGIYNAGTLSLVKSTISDNLSTEAGGGIYNTGMLNVTDSTFSGNRVDTGGLGSTIGGGGIYNTGTFTIADSTFAGNYGEASAGGGGGAISSMGTASIASSTFTGNGSGSGSAIYHGVQVLDISNSTFGGQTGGAAIAVDSGGVVDITNSTIANNSGVVRSGGIFLRTGRVTLRNSIVSGNSPADCYDGSLELWADAFNLDSDGTCRSATQKTTGEIGLGALADNGGPTETMALGPASAAIDAGNDAVCAAAVGSPTYGAGGKDQRGQTRNDLQCDTGAFEVKLSDTDTVVKSVGGAGAFTFGPTLAKIVVTNTGGCLTGLTVERTDTNHPNAGNGNLQTGHFWTITPTGCTSGFLADLTLPAVGFTPDASDKLCRYTGSGWDCAASSFDGTGKTITRDGVGQFSDWTVGNNVGPNAVTMRGFAAASGSGGAGALAALLLLGLGGLGLGAGLRRRGSRENRGQRTEDGSTATEGGEAGMLAAGYEAPAIVQRGTLKHFAGSPLGIDPLDPFDPTR